MIRQPSATPSKVRRKAATAASAAPAGPLPKGVETMTAAAGKADVLLADGSGNPFADIGGSKNSYFNSLIYRAVLQSAWIAGEGSARQDNLDRVISGSSAALVAFKPMDEIEGMMAAQAVALHFGAMECFRRSMIPAQSADAASRLRRDGANLSRAMVELVDAIDRRRGKGPKQVVRVERVVVQDGGQAIVGNVMPAGRRDLGEGA